MTLDRTPPAQLDPLARARLIREYLTADQLCTSRYPCLDLAPRDCTARSLDEPCYLKLAWRLRERLVASGIPPLYWEATFDHAFDSFRTDPHSHFSDAQAWIERYDENIRLGRNVVLRGDVGKGKTFLAMCMLNALVDRGVAVFAISAPRIGAKLHSKRELHNGKLEGFRRLLYSVPVLLVDEWMTQYNDEWVVTEFQAIFRERTDRKRPIIATTNLRKEKIVALPTTWPEFKPVIDRLFDKADEWVLTVREDYRQAGQRLGDGAVR